VECTAVPPKDVAEVVRIVAMICHDAMERPYLNSRQQVHEKAFRT